MFFLFLVASSFSLISKRWVYFVFYNVPEVYWLYTPSSYQQEAFPPTLPSARVRARATRGRMASPSASSSLPLVKTLGMASGALGHTCIGPCARSSDDDDDDDGKRLVMIVMLMHRVSD